MIPEAKEVTMTEKARGRRLNPILVLLAITILVLLAAAVHDHETWVCENGKCETLECELACDN